MSYSNYLENALLDHFMGKAAFAQPTLYLGLSAADPLDDGSGLSEPAAGGYARVATVAADWNAAVAGLIDNANDLSFPVATAPWGPQTHFFLADAAVGGNLLVIGPLNATRDIQTNDQPYFPAGDLHVTLD